MSATILLARLSAVLVKLLRLVLLFEMFFFFAATGLSYFKDVQDHKFLAQALAFESVVERPAAMAVKRILPTNFKGTDISRWLFIFAVYLLSTVLGRLRETLAERADYLRRRQAAAQAEGLESLEKSLQALARGEKLDRKKLLQIYAQTKKTLESQKRHAAFLCIDVVDSTGMKVGEPVETAERDFVLYRKMVERHLKTHRALKSTWTPDGVMICFGGAQDAVRAAQAILIGLEEFNRNIKAVKHDFALRVGINAGEVSYDDTMPMEEMTDRVIDITGHMQKHGTINAICISRQAVEPLLAQFPFRATDRVVDGCQVYEWDVNDARRLTPPFTGAGKAG